MNTLLVYAILGFCYLLSWAVKRWLNTTYRTWSNVPNQHGVTGAQTAAVILRDRGVTNVKIEATPGKLTDHFDPQRDILRLSRDIYSGTSVAAMAVSAHEAGHAIQDATGDIRLRLRRYLVPAAALGARLGPFVLIGALVMQSGFILRIAMFLLASTMLFQILTLPVEFNASKRALDNLERLGLSDPAQRAGTERVLRAAALTYVAAAVTSIAYFATLFATRGSSRSV